MAQVSSPSAWTGPSAKEMIESGTLCDHIIDRHGGPEPVFDDEELIRLRKFVNNPERADIILKESNMQDEEGDTPGAAAQRKGSLAGYIIATHGTARAALSQVDVDTLRAWFASENSEGSHPSA